MTIARVLQLGPAITVEQTASVHKLTLLSPPFVLRSAAIAPRLVYLPSPNNSTQLGFISPSRSVTPHQSYQSLLPPPLPLDCRAPTCRSAARAYLIHQACTTSCTALTDRWA